jgi:hypothetical protein
VWDLTGAVLAVYDDVSNIWAVARIWEECVPKTSPFAIRLSPDEGHRLQQVARKYTAPYRDVIRAKIVLLAAQGLRNDQIAERVDLPVQIVSKWRKRFWAERLAGLQDRPRHSPSGAPSPEKFRGM